MPLTAKVFCISQFLSPLITRFGSRVLLASGSILVAIGLIGLALLTEGDGYLLAILVPLLLQAVGNALVFAPGTVAIMHGVSNEHAGAASGVLQKRSADSRCDGEFGVNGHGRILGVATEIQHNTLLSDRAQHNTSVATGSNDVEADHDPEQP